MRWRKKVKKVLITLLVALITCICVFAAETRLALESAPVSYVYVFQDASGDSEGTLGIAKKLLVETSYDSGFFFGVNLSAYETADELSLGPETPNYEGFFAPVAKIGYTTPVTDKLIWDASLGLGAMFSTQNIEEGPVSVYFRVNVNTGFEFVISQNINLVYDFEFSINYTNNFGGDWRGALSLTPFFGLSYTF